MTLKSKLQTDLEQAMRNQDTLRRGVIRYIRSEIHNQEIAKQADLDDTGVLGVLTQQAQQRRDSIQAYTDGHRSDLADQEKSELAIILEYLPEQLTRQEIITVVDQVIHETGAKDRNDIGKVMSKLMPQLRGKAEGKEVNLIVTEKLRNSVS